MAMALLGVTSGWCRLPDGVGWAQMYGVALLTGIGFTMSLFIGTLAFQDPVYGAEDCGSAYWLGRCCPRVSAFWCCVSPGPRRANSSPSDARRYRNSTGTAVPEFQSPALGDGIVNADDLGLAA